MKYQLGKDYVAEETSNCYGKMLDYIWVVFSCQSWCFSTRLGTRWHHSDCHADIALCDLFLPSAVLLNDIWILGSFTKFNDSGCTILQLNVAAC